MILDHSSMLNILSLFIFILYILCILTHLNFQKEEGNKDGHRKTCFFIHFCTDLGVCLVHHLVESSLAKSVYPVYKHVFIQINDAIKDPLTHQP